MFHSRLAAWIGLLGTVPRTPGEALDAALLRIARAISPPLPAGQDAYARDCLIRRQNEAAWKYSITKAQGERDEARATADAYRKRCDAAEDALREVDRQRDDLRTAMMIALRELGGPAVVSEMPHVTSAAKRALVAAKDMLRAALGEMDRSDP